MNRPWLLPALVAGLFVSLASADVPNAPNDVAAKFLADENITYMSRVGQLVVFRSIIESDKAYFDATIGRVTSNEEFDALVARARALDAKYKLGLPVGPEPKLSTEGKPGPAITGDDHARLEGVVTKAAESTAGWMNSLRAQVGSGPSEDGYTNFGGGGMFRLGYGSEKAGSIGVQGGAIGASNGSVHKLLDSRTIDRNHPWERPFEVYEETRRHVSGLNKARIGGVSYVSPKAGGRVALEAGVDIGYARLNTAPEIVRETYIHEFVRLGSCYDGICEDWQTRRLSREVLHEGPGFQQSGWGNTVYGAAHIQLRQDSPWAVRVEVAKDRFKAFPEASGMTYSGGVVYNIGK